MKNSSECAKKLTKLLKSLPNADGDAPDAPPDPLQVLVQSVLMWESTTERASAVFDKLLDSALDYNDLRVSLPYELVSLIGGRYPRVQDRARVLRSVLNDIYLREHEVTLARLNDLGKRETKRYIETLEGIPPYVASRTVLLCFDVHAIPVDEQLRSMLIAEGAADESADVEELTAWLSRQVKASDGLATHLAFQQWVDSGKTRTNSRTRSTSRKKKKNSRARVANET